MNVDGFAGGKNVGTEPHFTGAGHFANRFAPSIDNFLARDTALFGRGHLDMDLRLMSTEVVRLIIASREFCLHSVRLHSHRGKGLLKDVCGCRVFRHDVSFHFIRSGFNPGGRLGCLLRARALRKGDIRINIIAFDRRKKNKFDMPARVAGHN